jgi:hypothetical protein
MIEDNRLYNARSNKLPEAKIKIKKIEEVYKVNNTKIKVTYEDSTSEFFSVIKLESRKKALELCELSTKIELLKPSAFYNLNIFLPKSYYNRLRNYEIEEYLDKITGTIGHRINDLCPFNGYNWFK